MILLKIENTFESKNDRKILIKSAASTPDKTPARPSEMVHLCQDFRCPRGIKVLK